MISHSYFTLVKVFAWLKMKIVEDYDEGLRFFICATFAAISIILCLILIIGFLQFQQLLPLLIVQKRYPKIVLFESILAIIIMLCYIPTYNVITFKIDTFKEEREYIFIFTFLFYPLCHGVTFCEVCRLWLICYDMNYSHFTANNSWKSQINQQFGIKNWWAKHRKSYGNYEYITKRFIIYGLFTGFLTMILYEIYGLQQWNQLLDACLYGIPLCLLLYAYYISPKITKDNFYFELECKVSVIFYVITLLLYFIGTITLYFDAFIGQFIISIDALFAFSFVSILSTLYIPKVILSKIEWRTALVINNQYTKSDNMNLQNIFCQQQKLESFALHLNNEFSLECLLSFIEMMQFKQYFNEIYFGQKMEYIMLEGKKIRFDFGESELKSAIVFETEHDKDHKQNRNKHGSEQTSTESFTEKNSTIIRNFKIIAYKLYQKYIREYCELEINIPSTYRLEYGVMMKNKKEWIENVEILPNDLLTLFDDVCMEMFKLMDHSFARFKRSDEYLKLIDSDSGDAYNK